MRGRPPHGHRLDLQARAAVHALPQPQRVVYVYGAKRPLLQRLMVDVE